MTEFLSILFRNDSIDYSLIHRCVCPSGFRKIGTTGSDECEDIDECFHNPDICGEGGECRNIQGKKNTIILLFPFLKMFSLPIGLALKKTFFKVCSTIFNGREVTPKK